MKVLLADDDLDILDITAYALRREGFVVLLAPDGEQALEMWRDGSPDVVLLDARMPKRNGFEVLRTIREQAETPVIMVTARSDEEDIVRGLELGADDYVVKPFSPRQLAARVRAVARRMRLNVPETPTELSVSGLVLDIEAHEVVRDGQQVRMTPIEFRILYLLMLNAGRVVPSSRLIEKTWGFQGGDSNMLKTHISHIRSKLGREPGTPGYIRNLTGVGYLMER